MSKTLAKSIFIYGIGVGLSQSIIILLLPAYTKVLSAEAYGIFELLYSGFLLMNLIGMFQLDSAAGRFYFEAQNDKERKDFTLTGLLTVLTISCLIGLSIFFLSGWFSEIFFDTTKYASAIKIISISIPIINGYYYLLVITRFNNKPWLFVIVSLVQVSCTVFFTFYFLFQLQYTINGILLANLLGYTVAGGILIIYYRFILLGTFNKSILKKYFGFSLPLFPAVIGSWLNNHSAKFLMLIYLSKEQVGIFAAALKVASIFKLGDYVFRMAWAPFYLKEIKKKGHKDLFISIFNKVLLLSGVILIVLHLLREPLVKLLFSREEFYKAKEYISPLALSIVLTIFVQIVGIGTIITKKTIYNSYNILLSILVFIAFFFVLTPIFEIKGVIYSQLAGALTLFIVSWYNSNKLYPINFNKIYTLIFIICILFMVMYN